MTKPNYTHIHILFDRSGSMGGRESDVQNWYKIFMEDQKKMPGECTVSMATFDTSYEVEVEWADIKFMSPTFTLKPRGGTALLDSAVRSINDLGAKLANMQEEERPSNVIVVVQTDGAENSSRTYSLEQLRTLITQQREQYNWQFMFLGADIDAYAAGMSMGVSSASVASYGNNLMGYTTMAWNSSAAIGRLRSGAALEISYTADEQKEMEDTKTP